MVLLIVEDNLRMRRLMKSLIADLAETICECDDGAAAIQLYAERRPDWVLMDIGLKCMDGLAASRRIMTEYPEARIVIVTSSDDAGLREAAHSVGALAYVLKDNLFDVRQLLQTSPPVVPTH